MGYRLIRNISGCMAIDGVSWSKRSADWDPRHDGWPQPFMVGHWSIDYRYFMRRNLFRSPPARGGGDSYQQVRSTRLAWPCSMNAAAGPSSILTKARLAESTIGRLGA